MGLYGFVFVDFGDEFTIYDKIGEQNQSVIVAQIT